MCVLSIITPTELLALMDAPIVMIRIGVHLAVGLTTWLRGEHVLPVLILVVAIALILVVGEIFVLDAVGTLASIAIFLRIVLTVQKQLQFNALRWTTVMLQGLVWIAFMLILLQKESADNVMKYFIIALFVIILIAKGVTRTTILKHPIVKFNLSR